MYCQEREGKYRFFESYIDPQTGKRRRVSVTLDKNTTRSRKEAAGLLAKKIRARQQAHISDKITLQALIDSHLIYVKPRVSEGTYRNRVSRSKTIIRLFGGSCNPEKLSAADIDRALKSYQYGQTSLMQNLRAIMHYGVRAGLITTAHGVDTWTPWKKAETVSASEHYLTDEETARLLAAILPKYKNLTEFLLLSGCRVGEALALRECDYDNDARRLSITKTVDPQTGKIHEPKTKTSRRAIYTQPELSSLIKKVMEENKETRTRIHEKGDLLFIDRVTGLPLKADGLRYALKQAAKKAGIKKHVTPHILRHTHASILYANMIDKDQIARRLGHAPGEESKITLAIYIHITEQREKAEEALLDRISFAKATNSATIKTEKPETH